jgi:hypothetical protein
MRTNMVSPYAKYPCYRVRIVLHDRQTRDVTVLGIEIAGVLSLSIRSISSSGFRQRRAEYLLYDDREEQANSPPGRRRLDREV